MRKSASGWPGWRILWPRNDLAPLLRWCSQCSAGYSKSRYFCFSNNFSKLGPISLRCDILVKLESVFAIYATPQVKTRFDWIRSTLINRSIVCILLSWHRDKENDSYKSDRLKACIRRRQLPTKWRTPLYLLELLGRLEELLKISEWFADQLVLCRQLKQTTEQTLPVKQYRNRHLRVDAVSEWVSRFLTAPSAQSRLFGATQC